MKKNEGDDFSFDKDPGKLKDSSDDLEFTFSDIPVLGVRKETKDAFSFDSMNEESGNNSFGSQETLISETAYGMEDEVDEFLREGDEVEEQPFPTPAPRKKKKLIIFFLVVFIIMIIAAAAVPFLFTENSDTEQDIVAHSGKQLSEKEKEELRAKRLKEKTEKLLNKANGLLESKMPDKAEKVYEEIIKLDPKNAVAYYGLGECFLQTDKTDEAIKYLKKSIEIGNAPEVAYQKLSNLYLKNKNFDARCAVLKNATKAYPEKYYFAIDYADSLVSAGAGDKALEVYRQIPRKVMEQKALMRFAELTQNFSEKEAIDIYRYTGNKFLVFGAFEKAAALTKNAQKKASVYSEAVDAFSNAPQDIKIAFLDNSLYLKLKSLADAEDNQKAAETLESIDLLRLDKKFLKQLVPLASKIKYEKLKEFVLKLLEMFPEDMELHLANQQYLINHEKPKFVLELYSEYWTKASDTPLANFLCGKAVQYSPKIAKKYFSEAIRLKSDFSQARIELGKIYFNERKWKEAEKLFAYSLNLDKKNKKLHYYYALAALKGSGKPKPVEEYEAFLKSTKMSKEEQAVELMPLAFMLPNSNMVDKLILQLQDSKKFAHLYKIFKAQRYLAFRGKSQDAFSGAPLRGRFRELCILNMLRHGELRKILMMPTPKEEFPEFWKIFIMRRNNMKTWKAPAEEFLAKHKNDTNITEKLIIKLWLGQIDIPSAEKKINIIPFEKEPLLLFMVADEYKREKNRPKSTIRYRKALAYGRNIYTDVIKFFMKH